MARYTINNLPGRIDTECAGDVTRRILQNCKNLLMCRMGEVPYDRLRGLNPQIYELPVSDVQEQLLPEIDRVLAWEPRATAISAAAERNAQGDTIISVIIDISE